eukprot:SAG22_NODE_560_length_9102_cov_54.310785_4_plen_244_part_00
MPADRSSLRRPDLLSARPPARPPALPLPPARPSPPPAVVDGVRFAAGGFKPPAGAAAGGDLPSGQALLAETPEEAGCRAAREAATAAVKARQKAARVGDGGRSALQEAAMIGDLKKLQKELAKTGSGGRGGKEKKKAKEKEKKDGGGSLDTADPRGNTAFHHACAGGHLDCVKELVKAGCDTLRTNDGGATGWALAKQGRREPTLAALRKYGGKGHAHLGLEFALEQAVAAEEAAAAAAAALY